MSQWGGVPKWDYAILGQSENNIILHNQNFRLLGPPSNPVSAHTRRFASFKALFLFFRHQNYPWNEILSIAFFIFTSDQIILKKQN